MMKLCRRCKMTVMYNVYVEDLVKDEVWRFGRFSDMYVYALFVMFFDILYKLFSTLIRWDVTGL